MKILLYNWDKIDGRQGGGVLKYNKYLAESLTLRGHEVTCLSSGLLYDFTNELTLKEYRHSLNPAIKAFAIINSPVVAPASQSGKNLEYYLNDKSLYELVKSFIIKSGGFDVIHFNNLEGLSLKVLALKKEFPNTKFIYSLHNYFPLCTNVYLWRNFQNINCTSHSGADCLRCFKYNNYAFEKINRSQPTTLRQKIYKKIARAVVRAPKEKCAPDLYEKFTSATIEAVNNYMDLCLAVSKRVAKIYADGGLSPEKIKTSYIGTKVAEHQLESCSADINGDPFNIVYMGYMSKNKGFFFFLDAMYKLDPSMAKNISLTIAARHNDKEEIIKKIMGLRDIFREVKLLDGYTADNQQEILRGKHLGIVPVLWEDNLPQVAIEQVAYGVPILVSDMGGAAEISGNNPHFVFKAGDFDDFSAKLQGIYGDRNLLTEFWENKLHFPTLEEHIGELEGGYLGTNNTDKLKYTTPLIDKNSQ